MSKEELLKIRNLEIFNLDFAVLNDKLERLVQSNQINDDMTNYEARLILMKINHLDKELETYKKIAEKLADTLYEVFCLRPMTVSKVLRKQGFDDNKCEECEDSCYQCLLDWARKEVEKDE